MSRVDKKNNCVSPDRQLSCRVRAMSKTERHQYEGFALAVLKLKTSSFKGSYWQFGLFELVRTENDTVFFDFKSIEFALQKLPQHLPWHLPFRSTRMNNENGIFILLMKLIARRFFEQRKTRKTRNFYTTNDTNFMKIFRTTKTPWLLCSLEYEWFLPTDRMQMNTDYISSICAIRDICEPLLSHADSADSADISI